MLGRALAACAGSAAGASSGRGGALATGLAAGRLQCGGGGAVAGSAPARVWAALESRRWGHNIKAPGVPYKVYHPHIQEPERKVIISGSLDGPAKYVPRNFRHQQFVESIRTGEYLGPDWPYNFLGRSFWQARRYNVIHNPIPADASPSTGVLFHARLNVWSVEWYERGSQRIRWFRAQYGFERAKQSAEAFRRELITAGRVDNRRSKREVRQQELQGMQALRLVKKKFTLKDARRVGNSGSKRGPQKKVRKDYQARGLLP